MNLKRIATKIQNLCVISVIIISVVFIAVACAKVDDTPSSKDITTDANKIYFSDHYVMPYYMNMEMDFNGELTSNELGDQILRCSMNNNDYVDIQKYMEADGGYIIPQDIGDQIIKNRFDLASVDHSKISCYNDQKKAYVISSDMFGQDAYVCAEIESITQTGNIVTVTASIYDPDEENLNADGTEKPNYDKKLVTLKFTLKSNGDYYLYDKVETTWKAK